MSSQEEVSRATLLEGPASEPVTLTEAKKQCEIAASDTAHDDHLTLLIQAAREQWEHDTDSCVLTQVWSVTLDDFGGESFRLPKRPITEIVDIQYYDSGNVRTTLSTDVYSFNPANRSVHLNSLQTWPSTYERWDAVTVTYVAGYDYAADVPAVHKQAMRLLIGHYFENRDMIMADAMSTIRAYNALVSRFVRSTYP